VREAVDLAVAVRADLPAAAAVAELARSARWPSPFRPWAGCWWKPRSRGCCGSQVARVWMTAASMFGLASKSKLPP
jgi:hypothetical protein